MSTFTIEASLERRPFTSQDLDSEGLAELVWEKLSDWLREDEKISVDRDGLPLPSHHYQRSFFLLRDAIQTIIKEDVDLSQFEGQPTGRKILTDSDGGVEHLDSDGYSEYQFLVKEGFAGDDPFSIFVYRPRRESASTVVAVITASPDRVCRAFTGIHHGVVTTEIADHLLSESCTGRWINDIKDLRAFESPDRCSDLVVEWLNVQFNQRGITKDKSVRDLLHKTCLRTLS